MVLYKQETACRGEISHQRHKVIKLESFVYSYDKDIGRLVLPVCSVDNETLFNDVQEVFYLMTATINGEQVKVQKSATVEGDNVIVIVPEELKGYTGRVNMSIYFKLNTGQQIDGLRYTFHMVLSDIDENLPELEVYYYEKFEDMLEDFRQQLQDIVNGIEIDIDEQIERIKDKVHALENRVDLFESEMTNKMNVLESDINEFKAQMETEIQSIQNDINTFKTNVQAQLDAMQTDIDGVNDQLQTIMTKIGEVNSQIITIQGKLTQFETTLSNLETRQSQLDTLMDDLESRIAKIEADLSALLVNYYTKTEVDNLLTNKADKSNVYTKDETNTKLNAKANKDTAQLKKVTADNGQALSTVSSDNALLDKIKEIGAGTYTIDVSSTATDTPQVGQTFTALVQNVHATLHTGNVRLVTRNGREFMRSFVSGSWQGKWVEMADKDITQNTKITSDTGNVIATIGSGSSLLEYVLSYGLGYYTLRVSSGATDIPKIGQTFSAVVQCVSASGYGNITLISDNGRVFTRTFYNGAWYTNSEWVEKADVSKAQMKKVTNDNGTALLTVGTGQEILTQIKTLGAGIFSVNISKTALGVPKNNTDYRAIVQNIDPNLHTGNVRLVGNDGKEYTRAFVSGNWVGEWVETADVAKAQMQKITLDSGERKATFSNANTLLTDLMNLGAGVHNVAITGGAISGLGAIGAMRGLFIRNASPYGNILMADDGGQVFSRGVNNGAWGGDWVKSADSKKAQMVKVTEDSGRSKATISENLRDSLVNLGAGVHSVICMPAVMDGLTNQAVRGILTLNTATYGSFSGVDDTGRMFYININGGNLGTWKVITQPNTSANITLATGMQAYSGQQPKFKTIANNDGTQTVYLAGIIQKTGGTTKFTDGETIANLGSLPSTVKVTRNRILTATSDGSSPATIRLTILNTGVLHAIVRGGDTSFISLEGISFITE